MATIVDIINMYGGTAAEKLFFRREVNRWLRREVNRWFRQNDQSHLWPICGRFNATERAIRRVRRLERQGLAIASVLEYALAVDEEISRIVNAAA